MLEDVLQKANQLRVEGRWREALAGYKSLVEALGPRAELLHNMALCELGLQNPKGAQSLAAKALSASPGLWQAQIVLAKSQRQTDTSGEEAERTLVHLCEQVSGLQGASSKLQHTIQAHANLERAEIALNAFCDPQSCLDLVGPLTNDSTTAERARLSRLVAQLYFRNTSDKDLSREACEYAGTFIAKPKLRQVISDRGRQPKLGNRRPRIGLLSPSFHAGPVYYLCYQTLALLSEHCDLVFFSRGVRVDWASEVFHHLAADWHSAESLSWQQLASVMTESNLDLLLELGGWMDVEGLKAVSQLQGHPTIKWVGGQAMTTGLPVFSGFISDAWQSPASTHSLFVEPLWKMPLGYVSYQRPAFWPGPCRRRRRGSYGLIGNPSKIGIELLPTLMKLKALGANRLWMIDRRYAHPRIVKRIRADLELSGLKLEFVTPKDHQDFLVEISKLEYMVDTRPYSAGLTAREALSLGVQIISEPGPLLFSSRHGLAANAQQTKLLRQFSSSTDEARQNRVAQQLAQRIRKTIQAEGRAN